jgi:ABC-type transport system involved in multi-copper enzyme maturation permease subunit
VNWSRFVPSWFALPLLSKDLAELAARRRTYRTRVLYAVLLFIAFAIAFGELSPRSSGNPLAMAGAGRSLFSVMMVLQFIGVYLFLPSMVAGAVTSEKETGALPLLMLTTLTPWQIILQKLVGRLVPMLTFILLALPLTALSYSYGGLDSEDVGLSVLALFTTCLQVGSLALMLSTICRSTSVAIVRTYGVIIVGYLGVWLLTAVVMFTIGPVVGRTGPIWMYPAMSWMPWLVLTLRSAPFGAGTTTSILAAGLVLPWLWIVLFLMGARRFLETRALTPAKRPRDLFRMLSDWMTGRRAKMKSKGLKRRTAKTKESLPTNRPIYWREVGLTSLGSLKHFATTTAIFGGPLLLVAHLIAAGIGRRDATFIYTAFVVGVGLIGVASVVLNSTTSFVAERTKGTLDILLVTPMTGRQIVAEKAAVVRQRVLLLVAILGMLFVGEALTEASWGVRSNADLGPVGYLFTMFLSVPIYLLAIGWVAQFIGLNVHARTRAVTIGLAVAFGWLAGPAILAGLSRSEGWLVFSPAAMIILAESAHATDVYDDVFDAGPAAVILVSLFIHVGILLMFRWLCLDGADRLLGRASGADRWSFDAKGAEWDD